MNIIRPLTLSTGLMLLGGLLATGSARADVSYLLDINTAALIGNANGPFSLDFQSNYGSGIGDVITLSNFNFTGGGPNGSASTFGTGVVGSLGGTLTFTANPANVSSEFFQQFDAGVSDIQLKLTLTTNGAGITPTSFTASILDGSLANIPTSGPLDTLATATIDGASTTVLGYNSTGAFGGVTATLVPVPEPSATAAIFGALTLATVGLVRWGRRIPAAPTV